MMGESAVDRDRQAVYDAEDAAFGGTTMDEVMAWDDVESLVAAVVEDPWWKGLDVPAPVLVRTRTDSSTSRADGRSVRIAPAGQTGATVAHELAHHLLAHLNWAPAATETPHGPRFRATAQRVAIVVGGPVAGEQLSAACRRSRLSVAVWPFDEPAERPPRALRDVRRLGPPGSTLPPRAQTRGEI